MGLRDHWISPPKPAAVRHSRAMTSSKAFRCVQAWLLEKPAVWVGEDVPDLASALMVQQAPCETLLEAEHLQHRIELLEKQLGEKQREIRRAASAVLSRSSRRKLRAELALRWFEADEEWSGLYDYWSVLRSRGGQQSPPPRLSIDELLEEWRADVDSDNV